MNMSYKSIKVSMLVETSLNKKKQLNIINPNFNKDKMSFFDEYDNKNLKINIIKHNKALIIQKFYHKYIKSICKNDYDDINDDDNDNDCYERYNFDYDEYHDHEKKYLEREDYWNTYFSQDNCNENDKLYGDYDDWEDHWDSIYG